MKEIKYLNELADFSLPLVELRDYHIDRLIRQFGPRAVLRADAGHNNVQVVLYFPTENVEAAFWYGILAAVLGEDLEPETWCFYKSERTAWAEGLEYGRAELAMPHHLSGRAQDDFAKQAASWKFAFRPSRLV